MDLTSLILAQIGGTAATSLINRLFPDPYEQRIKNQANMFQQMLPQLQTQAAGGMTPALKGQFNQINRQVSRTQQSYGAQARAGSGTARTIPNRAVGGRIAAAGTEAKGAAIAESSQQAQNALLGIGQQAQAQQGALQQQRSAKISQLLANIGSMYAEYKLMQQSGQTNQYMENTYKMMNDWLQRELGLETPATAPSLPQQTPGYWNPSPNFYGRGPT